MTVAKLFLLCSVLSTLLSRTSKVSPSNLHSVTLSARKKNDCVVHSGALLDND